MVRASRVCTTAGCGTLTATGGKCPACESEADQARGGASQRGYGAAHLRFRRLVLRRDPHCVLCGAPSRHADHYPTDRRQLALRGENPNDPRHGRGLCGPCHSQETARLQPGGWYRDQGQTQG